MHNRTEAGKLSYVLKYGGRSFDWKEDSEQTMHKSLQVVVEYNLGFADQTVEVSVQAEGRE